MKQRLFYLILCLILLSQVFALTGCGKKPAAVEDPVTVQVETVQTGLQSGAFTYAGDVRGRYESQFAFQAAGRIKERLVNNGDAVKSGQVLMRIDVADLKTQLDQSRANLVSAQSDYKLSELTFKRYSSLAQQDVISKSEFDVVTANFEVTTSKLRSAEAAYVASSQQFEYSNLTADADGVIANIQVEAGQVVSVGQLALTLVRSGEVEIQINIPEQRVEDIRKARKVLVNFWALPGHELDGVVREVAGQADSATRTYLVRVSIPQSNKVRFGMSSTVKVWAGDTASLIVLPVAAVYQTETKPTVWVVENETLRLQPVELGDFVADGVVIRSGVKSGDVVVTAGVQKLREGQKVKIWDGRKI